MSIWHLYLYLEFLYFSLQLEHRLSSSSLTSASSDSDPESPSPTQLRRERRPAIYDAQVRTILMFLNVTETAGVKGFLRQLSWKVFFGKVRGGKEVDWNRVRTNIFCLLMLWNLEQFWHNHCKKKRLSQLFTAFYKKCAHHLS